MIACSVKPIQLGTFSMEIGNEASDRADKDNFHRYKVAKDIQKVFDWLRV
jgi:hypothetical protein